MCKWLISVARVIFLQPLRVSDRALKKLLKLWNTENLRFASSREHHVLWKHPNASNVPAVER